MPKNSETSHRVAATFQAGRDPEQDRVIEWLNSLAKNDKGQLHRSVLKFHLTKALLLYIQQTSGGVPLVMPGVLPAAAPRSAAPAAAAVVAAPVAPQAPAPVVADPIPTLTTPAPAPASAAPRSGGLSRSLIAKSMSNRDGS